MLQQSQNRFQRTGTDISAELSSTHNMIRASDRGSKYLCSISLYCKDIGYLFDEQHSVPAAVVNPPDKRRNISGPGLCSQYRLPCGKNQGAVCPDAIISKPF